MNPDFYTEEFRNFKYLKSTPSTIKFFKEKSHLINSVQPWNEINDPNFVWSHRVEFLEQVFDLRNDILYLVDARDMADLNLRTMSNYIYEDARLHEIINPVIYEGPVIPQCGKISSFDDIWNIEEGNSGYCLCTADMFTSDSTVVKQIFKITDTPLVNSNKGRGYSAIFYVKESAEKYRCAVTEFLRKNNDAVSAIARLF